MLEEEITAAERRRARLLAHITSQLASSGEPPLHPELLESAASDAATGNQQALNANDLREPDDTTRSHPDAADDEISTDPIPEWDREQGGSVVWDQLTPGDIERAKTELGTRRAEMLARHAEELKALDADQAQLDTLVEAVAAFVRKFSPPSAGGAVVQLDEQRGSRLQSHG
jgi:hypothetical protein